jgi:hypothetical protein
MLRIEGKEGLLYVLKCLAFVFIGLPLLGWALIVITEFFGG